MGSRTGDSKKVSVSKCSVLLWRYYFDILTIPSGWLPELHRTRVYLCLSRVLWAAEGTHRPNEQNGPRRVFQLETEFQSPRSSRTKLRNPLSGPRQKLRGVPATMVPSLDLRELDSISS